MQFLHAILCNVAVLSEKELAIITSYEIYTGF